MVTREQLLAQWENLSMDESWVNPHQHIEDLITAGDRLAAALAAPPPDETREALAILDELIELAESNIGRAQRLRDNPHFVQGDRVSYAVQAGVWGSLAETLKTRRACFPPSAQAPPPDETRDYVAELRECHELLTSCVGGVDPDEHPELVARINLMLGNCDTAGVCPAKVDPVPGSADYWREVAARLSTEVHLLAKAVHELAERKAAQAPSPWGHPDLIEGLWTAGANLRATNGCEELAEHCDTAARLLTEGPPAAQAPPPDPPGLADDRCAVCGWPLDPKEQMCRRGNCAMRPMPERAADPARAIAEYSAVWGGMARQTLQRWQEQLAEQIARQSDPPGLAALVAKWKATLAELSEVTKHYNYLVNVAHERVPLDVENRETAAVWAEVDARRALLAYDLSAPASPAPLPPVEVGDVVLLESGGVEYVRTKHAEDYWTGADAEGFPDVAERRKARILAIYRDPLWRRPAPMPTTGDES